MIKKKPIKNINFTNIDNIKIPDEKEFKKSETYIKYVEPTMKRYKKQKRLNRRAFLKDNWINITTLIFTILTFLATILFGLLQLLD